MIPDSKAHGANMGPIWGGQNTGGPHAGPMNFAIWDVLKRCEQHWCGSDISETDLGFGFRFRVAHNYIQTCLSNNWEPSCE